MKARSGGWERAVLHGHVPEHPTSQAAGTEYFSLDVEDVPAAGSRPDRLSGVRPQERLQQHPVDQIVDTAPALPILDVPVLLMGEQLVDVLRFFDTLCPVAEQVIDVPKISLEDIPARRLCRSWWNSWWMCQLSCTFLSRKLTFQFLVVEGDMRIFKVFTLDRVQQRRSFLRNAFLSGLWSRTWIFLEVFKVYAQYRVQQRLRHPQFLGLQLIGSTLRIRCVKVFFRTFSPPNKSAKVTRHSSARVPRSASSSELSAHQMARAARPQDFSDDGNIFREDEEKIWIRLDTGQWKLLCTDTVVDQPWS